MYRLPLLLNDKLKILSLILIKINLLPECAALNFKVINLLLHEILILLKLRAHSLQTFLVILLIHTHCSMIIYFDFKSIPFFLNFFHSLVCKLKLMGQVIDMTLKCFYFGNVVLFFLLELFDHVL